MKITQLEKKNSFHGNNSRLKTAEKLELEDRQIEINQMKRKNKIISKTQSCVDLGQGSSGRMIA
jgi:hypothetical protein